jgi:hypothetical protein
MLIFVKIKLALAESKSMIEPDLKGMPYTYSPRLILFLIGTVPDPSLLLLLKYCLNLLGIGGRTRRTNIKILTLRCVESPSFKTIFASTPKEFVNGFLENYL